jgi:hypothetical protein
MTLNQVSAVSAGSDKPPELARSIRDGCDDRKTIRRKDISEILDQTGLATQSFDGGF